jgi:acyl dehydratase
MGPIDDRYFEDYVPGTVHEFGMISVDEPEIVEFARRFDPQFIHIDEKRAKSGPYAGLIASGWHTTGLMMRLYADHFLSSVASLGGPGVDELRWLKPVRPGDELRMRVTVLDKKRSASKPDRGIIRVKTELINQAGQVVLTLIMLNILALRNPSA